jgi:hypothetical protein
MGRLRSLLPRCTLETKLLLVADVGERGSIPPMEADTNGRARWRPPDALDPSLHAALDAWQRRLILVQPSRPTWSRPSMHVPDEVVLHGQVVLALFVVPPSAPLLGCRRYSLPKSIYMSAKRFQGKLPVVVSLV